MDFNRIETRAVPFLFFQRLCRSIFPREFVYVILCLDCDRCVVCVVGAEGDGLCFTGFVRTLLAGGREDGITTLRLY